MCPCMTRNRYCTQHLESKCGDRGIGSGGVRGHIIDCSEGDVALEWSNELESESGGV